MERESPTTPSPLRTGSYGSVTITWLDREAARAAAEEAARALADAHPEVTGVLLFGSIARGDAVPGSDVDLLVALRDSEVPFRERLARYEAVVPGLGVEIFPYTEEEIARLREEPGSLVATAMAEGEWVVGPGRKPGD